MTATSRRLTGDEIRALIGRLGSTHDQAAEVVRSCGDPELIRAIAAREQGIGSDVDGPLDVYPEWLRELADERG